MGKKLTIEYAKQFFEDRDCELLETEYINTHTKMRYICICREESYIRFRDFKLGKRCKRCGIKKRAERRRHTLEYAEQFFKDNNCTLLEKKYTNSYTKMRYRCSCGNISYITFNNFRHGRRCKKCGYKKISNKKRYTHKYVYEYFESYGCILLEKKYIGVLVLMEYICECGEKSKITFDSFKRGTRCKKCAIKRNSGKNHWKYNPNLTNKEREINKSRHSDYNYKKWVKNTFKKDRYTCQKCLKEGVYLNAHHIESWGSHEKLRLDKNNGITFCVDCHHDFHKKYGYGNNTKEQLDEFLKITVL